MMLMGINTMLLLLKRLLGNDCFFGVGRWVGWNSIQEIIKVSNFSTFCLFIEVYLAEPCMSKSLHLPEATKTNVARSQTKTTVHSLSQGMLLFSMPFIPSQQ